MRSNVAAGPPLAPAQHHRALRDTCSSPKNACLGIGIGHFRILSNVFIVLPRPRVQNGSECNKMSFITFAE